MLCICIQNIQYNNQQTLNQIIKFIIFIYPLQSTAPSIKSSSSTSKPYKSMKIHLYNLPSVDHHVNIMISEFIQYTSQLTEGNIMITDNIIRLRDKSRHILRNIDEFINKNCLDPRVRYIYATRNKLSKFIQRIQHNPLLNSAQRINFNTNIANVNSNNNNNSSETGNRRNPSYQGDQLISSFHHGYDDGRYNHYQRQYEHDSRQNNSSSIHNRDEVFTLNHQSAQTFQNNKIGKNNNNNKSEGKRNFIEKKFLNSNITNKQKAESKFGVNSSSASFQSRQRFSNSNNSNFNNNTNQKSKIIKIQDNNNNDNEYQSKMFPSDKNNNYYKNVPNQKENTPDRTFRQFLIDQQKSNSRSKRKSKKKNKMNIFDRLNNNNNNKNNQQQQQVNNSEISKQHFTQQQQQMKFHNNKDNKDDTNHNKSLQRYSGVSSGVLGNMGYNNNINNEIQNKRPINTNKNIALATIVNSNNNNNNNKSTLKSKTPVKTSRKTQSFNMPNNNKKTTTPTKNQSSLKTNYNATNSYRNDKQTISSNNNSKNRINNGQNVQNINRRHTVQNDTSPNKGLLQQNTNNPTRKASQLLNKKTKKIDPMQSSSAMKNLSDLIFTIKMTKQEYMEFMKVKQENQGSYF